MAYVKSNINGKEFKNEKEYDAFTKKSSVFTQFITLEGKIIKTNNTEIKLQSAGYMVWGNPKTKFVYNSGLLHRVQLKNISKKGFACFFGNDKNCYLNTYDLTGKELWSNTLSSDVFSKLLTSKEDIYLLQKTKGDVYNSRYSILSYNSENGKAYPRIDLKDKIGSVLNVLSFENDITTGTPYVSGSIIDLTKKTTYHSGKGIARGVYSGVFTIDIKGHTKADIKETFSYWSDGSKKPSISTTGYISETKSYSELSNSFRDHEGNTYFAGSEIIKKKKIGALVSSIILAPMITPSLLILGISGTNKSKVTETVVLKQSPKGVLRYENEILCEDSKYTRGVFEIYHLLQNRSFYNVENQNTKTNYLIVDDSKNIMIYNVKKKKVVQTVAHKDGRIKTDIFPAKEGHIMVVERNQKEKYLKLSIEALN